MAAIKSLRFALLTHNWPDNYFNWSSNEVYSHLHTVKPLWKGQECLTKVAKFGPFPCTILNKSWLFYPSWQAASFERPTFWVAFIERFYCMLISKQHFWYIFLNKKIQIHSNFTEVCSEPPLFQKAWNCPQISLCFLFFVSSKNIKYRLMIFISYNIHFISLKLNIGASIFFFFLYSGPFVMNSQEEIAAAIMDFREGKNGFERALEWKSYVYRQWIVSMGHVALVANTGINILVPYL